VDERDADVVLDPLQLELHLLAELQVERPERLVEEEDAWAVHERAGERDPLLLAAGELARLALAEPRERDELEHLLDAALHVVAAHAAAPKPERDVLEDREVREERVALEDGVHVAFVRRQAAHVALAEQDAALRLLLEPADHPQRRRLAAPGRAEHGEEAARRDLEREVVHREHVVEALRDALERDVGRGAHRAPPATPVATGPALSWESRCAT
jgi:hypothetical protein